MTPELAAPEAGLAVRAAGEVAGAEAVGAEAVGAELAGAGDEGVESELPGCEAVPPPGATFSDVAPPATGSGATWGTGAASGDGAAAHVGAAVPAKSAASAPATSADRLRPPGEASRRTDGADWLWRFRYPLPGDASGAEGQ